MHLGVAAVGKVELFLGVGSWSEMQKQGCCLNQPSYCTNLHVRFQENVVVVFGYFKFQTTKMFRITKSQVHVRDRTK